MNSNKNKLVNKSWCWSVYVFVCLTQRNVPDVTDRQIDRQTDRQIDRQTDRQIYSESQQREAWSNCKSATELYTPTK